MGKNKQAQRTKNNARPSSSGRSAELLGTSVPNLVGFSAVKDGSYISVLPGLSIGALNDIDVSSLDPNFQSEFKKMNKKDPKTKSKALQKFAELCAEAKLEDVEAMLPFWPRFYRRLVIDTGHRVRQAAHLAHAAVVKRVGKNIAIYLKQLAGPWFTSQYDTYPPAASAAMNSFYETFPPNKIIDAIVHCQEEILEYIYDNIVVQVPQSLSAYTTLTTEEMEARYQRVLISSLQGYSLYLKKVPAREIEKTLELHRRIVGSNKYWKLARHEVPLVRTAFFNAMTSLIERADQLIRDEKKKAITAIVNSLDETDPGLLSAVWDCMLVAIDKIEDWHTAVNVEKLVLPKLWRALSSGGQCCAAVVYPNLLPFVGQFPKLNVNEGTLYTSFFDNMRQGLTTQCVQSSRSNMLAAVASFFECLRYVIHLKSGDRRLCEKLLQEQIIAVLEDCIRKSTPLKPIVFAETAQLLRHWSRNRGNAEYRSYPHLIDLFWTELRALLARDRDTEEPDNAGSLAYRYDSQVEFLLCLKSAPQSSRRNLRVKFSDVKEARETRLSSELARTDDGGGDDDDDDGTFSAELSRCVEELCLGCFREIDARYSERSVELLGKLVANFGSAELFVALARAYDSSGASALPQLYEKTLKRWLTKWTGQSDVLVELIFSLMRHMEESDAETALHSLSELCDYETLKYAVRRALSDEPRSDIHLRRWCSQPRVAALLMDVARAIAATPENGATDSSFVDREILALAFESSENGDPLVGVAMSDDLASILCDSPSATERRPYSASLVELLSRLSSVARTQSRPTAGSIKIFETLVDLSIEAPEDAADLLREVCKASLAEFHRKLPRGQFLELAERFSRTVWRWASETNTRDPTVERAVDVAADFLEVVLENDGEADRVQEIVATLLIASTIDASLIHSSEMILFGEVVSGELYVSSTRQMVHTFRKLVSIDVAVVPALDGTVECVEWALFVARLVASLYAKWVASREGNGNEETASTVDDDASSPAALLPGFDEIFANLVYVAVLGRSHERFYASTEHHGHVARLCNSLEREFQNLRRYIPQTIYDDVLTVLENSYKDVCMQPNALLLYTEKLGHPSRRLDEYLRRPRDAESELRNCQILRGGPDCVPSSPIGDLCAALVLTTKNLRSGYEPEFTEIFELVRERSRQDPDFLLYDRDVSQIAWERLALPLEVIRFFAQLADKVPTKLTREQWDLLLISLHSWISSVTISRHACDDVRTIALIVAVSELFRPVQRLMCKLEGEEELRVPDALLDEWKNLFVDDVQIGIARAWMSYAMFANRENLSPAFAIPLNELGRSMTLLNGKIFFGTTPELDTVDEMIELAAKLLRSPIPSLQLGAYHALRCLITKLVERDEARIESEKPDTAATNMQRFEKVLLDAQNIVNAMLMDFKLCDALHCTLLPYTDSYTYTLGYLFAWAVVLDICGKANAELRYRYAEMLKENDLFSCLLDNLFKLMPIEVLRDVNAKSPIGVKMFTESPSLAFEESWTERTLDHLVCWVYANTLRWMPLLVRQWWRATELRVSNIVDKITCLYVSSMLRNEELRNVESRRDTEIENMQVKVHQTSVVAVYQLEDNKLELCMRLPINHPLGSVIVEPARYPQWRSCHMQLSVLLTHQNGSIWDGLLLWKRILDKEFAGVEECYICYSIFHAGTFRIPNLSCFTCRKKFHTACLYKWIRTSQKATCPICRNAF